MSTQSTTDVASGVEAEPTKAKKSPAHFDTNPAKAGWFTKIVLGLLCFFWLVPLVGTFITDLKSEPATATKERS